MRPDRSFIAEALGELSPGFPTIVTGPTGSGRTVLCLELAHATIERGESAAFLTSEPARLLLRQASAMELELRPAIRSGQLALLELDPDVAATARNHGGDALYEAITTSCPEAGLLIIDPMDALTAEILDEVSLRAMVRALFDGAAANQQLLLSTVDSAILQHNLPLSRVLKGACGSFVELSKGAAEGTHVLRVVKSRAAGFVTGDMPFRIGPGGPVREAAPPHEKPHDNADSSPQPIATVDTPLDRQVARDITSHETGSPNTSAVEATNSEQAQKPACKTGRDRQKILIVEDDRLTRVMMTDYLEDKYDIVAAEDGFSAIKMVLSEEPDLLVLDLQLPRVSGFEVLGALRDGGATVPILVVSGTLSRAADRVRVLVLGATDMMRKPVQKFELRVKVQSLLQYASQGGNQREAGSGFDGADVEAILGAGPAMSILDEPRFIDRVARACRFCQEYDLPSVLVAFEATSAARRKQVLEAAARTLRAEDAVLPLPGGKRGILLLVSTEPEMVESILERIASGLPKPKKEGRPNRFHTHPAEPLDEIKDWDPLFGELIPWPSGHE